jgi:hypothetical protein
MPFAPEFHYFYLYLRQYIEERHKITCERADDTVLTISLWEKIRRSIQKADVVLADCTGKNPNVFYELGLAHAFDKKVILLTRDPVDSIPSDLRHFDFITYSPAGHVELLQKLDRALNAVFETRYDAEFVAAGGYLGEFAKACPEANPASKDEFVARYKAAESSGVVISPVQLLTFAVANTADVRIMEKIVDFVRDPHRERTGPPAVGRGEASIAEGPPDLLPPPDDDKRS